MRTSALWLERFLWAVGLMIAGYCGTAYISGRIQQAAGNRELDRLVVSSRSTSRHIIRPSYGGLVGRMEIPSLSLSGIVFEGTDDRVLGKGIGHLEGSAFPGQSGNVVLAAHRDTLFRPLRNIRQGDLVTVTTETGVRNYQVDSTKIVTPEQTEVLDPTPAPTLTLVTCYPFYYVGNAPKRFIVRAREVTDESVSAQNDSNRPVPAPAESHRRDPFRNSSTQARRSASARVIRTSSN